MFAKIWPVALVVLANTLYNICAKSTPENANAFLTLAVTYLIAAVICIAVFLVSSHGKPVLAELGRLNWTALALAAAIVALEVGYIFIYRAGWKMNAASLVANISLACVLVGVGALLYKEGVTIRQLAGIGVCLVGLVLLGK